MNRQTERALLITSIATLLVKQNKRKCLAKVLLCHTTHYQNQNITITFTMSQEHCLAILRWSQCTAPTFSGVKGFTYKFLHLTLCHPPCILLTSATFKQITNDCVNFVDCPEDQLAVLLATELLQLLLLRCCF